MHEAYEISQNIDKYLEEIENQRILGLVTNIPGSIKQAIDLARENTDPNEYRNKISNSLNPDKGLHINLDI